MTAAPAHRAVAVAAWCLYDWGYGAFNTVVSTFVFATYFVRAVAPDPTTGTAQWALAQSMAGLVIAALAAPLGVVADRGGRRWGMLVAFTVLFIACTAGLWFVRPVRADVPLALALVVGATICFEIAVVFYNAMLTDVAPPSRLGRISGIGWGMGYGGGLCCLLLCLLLLISPSPPLFGLDAAQAENIRATALLASLWMTLFCWPVLIFVPNSAPLLPWNRAMRLGLANLRDSLRGAWASRRMLHFLVARMLYTDGITTITAFGGIYAAGHFRMSAQEVLQLGIALNVTAGFGAITFAFIEDRIGAKSTVLTALVSLIVLSSLILTTSNRAVFWGLSLALGIFVGPAQAASRTLMARLSPEAERNAHFGLYALSGRVTGFVGPAALGIVTALTQSQRAGMAVAILLLASGAGLLAITRLRLAALPVA